MLKTELFDYKYIPARIKGPQEKVMIVLHGLGDSILGYTWFPSELGVDELSFLLVNAPDSYYGGFSWYDFMEDSAPGIIRSRGLLLHLIEEVVTQGVLSENIYLFGFSQGCLMALDLGLRTSLKLGGIVGVSGYLSFQSDYPEQLSPVAQEQAFLLTHGMDDPVVPYAPSKRQYAFLKTLGIPLTFNTYQKDHTILPEELTDIRNWLWERLKR